MAFYKCESNCLRCVDNDSLKTLTFFGCGCRRCRQAKNPANPPHLRPVQCAVPCHAVPCGSPGSARAAALCCPLHLSVCCCGQQSSSACDDVTCLCRLLFIHGCSTSSRLLFHERLPANRKPGVVLCPLQAPTSKQAPVDTAVGSIELLLTPRVNCKQYFLQLLFLFLSPHWKTPGLTLPHRCHNDTMSVEFHLAQLVLMEFFWFFVHGHVIEFYWDIFHFENWLSCCNKSVQPTIPPSVS